MNLEELLDAWRTNNAINIELLDLVSDEQMELKPGKGKTIRSNFVHIIGVRAQWIAEKLPQEAAAIPKLDWKTATRDAIKNGLQISHALMAKRLGMMDSYAKPGKQTAINHFAYCVAHEANHRAQIEIALRINGFEPDDQSLYSLWEWNKK